ncbi:sulfotransferase [Vibrio eleionomae]|uniref:sulfotransferase n=1 Tax=Vibrio eleionomae TaxID=2653505 RepID=UPI00136E2E56
MKHNKEFLFISGCDRSGTTALVRLLNNHEKICLGMERYKGLITKDCVSRLNKDRFKKENFFNIKDEETNIQWDYFYDPLKEKFDDCDIVGDKVPRYFQIYDDIESAFPKAKHIFIIRDPFDVASSWKVRAKDKNDINWVSTNDVSRSIQVWNMSLKKAYHFLKAKNGNMLVTRYEDVFSGNQSELERIVSFLGLDESSNLLESFQSLTQDWDKRKNKKSALNEDEISLVKNNAEIDFSNHLLNYSLLK